MVATFFQYLYAIASIVSLGASIYLANKNPRKAYKIWAVFGFFYTMVGTSLLYTLYPIDWMSEGILQVLGITIVVVAFAFCGAAYIPLGYLWKKHFTPWKKALLFSFCIMVADIVRSFLFSILFYGKGGSIGLHFDVTSLGHALSITPLIEYAYFGGTYVLTGILGLLVYISIHYKQIRYVYITPVAVLLGWIFIHVLPVYSPIVPMRVAVISTDFKEVEDEAATIELRKMRFAQLEKMTALLASSAPDIIVYPEDARFLRYLTEEKLQILRKTFPTTLFIDGDTRIFENGASNFSLFYETKGYEKGKNDSAVSGRGKTFLFPFSEYLPIAFSTLFPFFMSGTEYDAYTKNHTYTPIHAVASYLFNQTKVGTLLCSELFSYSTVKRITKDSPRILFFQSNLSIFHNRTWFMMHARAFIQISAATARTPIVQSANGTDSYIVSPYGKIIKTIPKGFAITILDIYPDSSIIIR